MTRFLVFIATLGFVCFAGCAGRNAPQVAAEADLRQFIAGFAEAVAQKDADAVYAMLGGNWHRAFDKGSFRTYFGENYDEFVELASQWHDDARPFSISGQWEGDPCASARFAFDDGGKWMLEDVPKAWEPPEDVRHALVQILKTQRFMRVLDEYFAQNPTISFAELRHVKRVIAYEPIPVDTIVLEGRHAVVDVPGTARLDLQCDAQGWRLRQCQLYR